MQVYKKTKKGKYKKLGYSDGWSGFPSDGIWLVTDGDGVHSSECIIKLDELETIKPAVNLIYEYKEQMIQYLSHNDNVLLNGVSANELVLDMLKTISKNDTNVIDENLTLEEVNCLITEQLFHVLPTDITVDGRKMDVTIIDEIIEDNKHILNDVSHQYFYDKFLLD